MSLPLGQQFVDPGAMAIDSYDGSVSVNVTGSVNIDVAGSYVLTYSAVDAAGNVGHARRTVVVVAAEKPRMQVLGMSPATVLRGQIYEDAGCTAEDALGRELSVSVQGVPVVTKYVHDVELTYSAEDAAGNLGVATRWVYVLDPEVEAQAHIMALDAYQAALLAGESAAVAANASLIVYTTMGGRENLATVLASIISLASARLTSASTGSSSSSSGSVSLLAGAVVSIAAIVLIALFLIYRKHKSIKLVQPGQGYTLSSTSLLRDAWLTGNPAFNPGGVVATSSFSGKNATAQRSPGISESDNYVSMSEGGDLEDYVQYAGMIYQVPVYEDGELGNPLYGTTAEGTRLSLKKQIENGSNNVSENRQELRGGGPDAIRVVWE